MNSIGFVEYLYAGRFIQKTAPETTVIQSKQASRRQQVSQLAKTAKGNLIRSQGPTTRGGGPIAMKVGQQCLAPYSISPI